ncbi:MAG: glycosyltransferase family 8 protein [Clostridiales bacterium]|nr:glycosyltransferase family 8 protein [Clostridiales bacterium]
MTLTERADNTITDNKVYVAYCCSDLFSEVCGVSIASLFENNRHIDNINVYIVDDKISDKNKSYINKLAESYRRSIEFIPLPDPVEFFCDERFTPKALGHSFARLIYGKVLPGHINRLLSLDCDTMVLGDLNELWQQDITGYAAAGVDDCMGKVALQKTQHLPPDAPHCNAGMLLFDLALWRKEDWTSKFYSYIRQLFDQGCSLGGYEEEVINRVLLNRIKILHPRFNLMTLEQVLSYDMLLKFRQPQKYYSEEEIREAISRPVITHTTNFFYVRRRIFEENSDHPMRKQYEKYRALTPWRNEAPIRLKSTIKQKFQKNIWHMMPKRAAVYLGAFVRNEIRPLLNKKRDDE